MSKDNNLHDFLQDVADAIKEKKGSNDAINAQDFSDEIKNLPSGSSPFAVDFGEEIATGNPAYINALQEDIDYYNEVVRSIESGEYTQEDYTGLPRTTGIKEFEFKEKIAFWPKNIAYRQKLGFPYTNLRAFVRPDFKITDGYYFFRENGAMQICVADFSQMTSAQWLFYNCSSLREIDLQNAPLTNADSIFYNCYNLRKINGLDVTKVTNANSMLQNCYSLTGKIVLNLENCTNIECLIQRCYKVEEIDINLPILTGSLQYSFRELKNLKKAIVNIPNIQKHRYPFYGSDNIEELYIKGLRVDTELSSKTKLTVSSIKYMCDNCLTRDDGAPYTLTLNAAVKTAFLAKCDEDAEYAASLASANAKGLTLA